MILKGEPIRTAIINELLEIDNPGSKELVFIYNEFDVASLSYVKFTAKLAVAMGCITSQYPVSSFLEAQNIIEEANKNSNVKGIIIARPLGIKGEEALFDLISPSKDIDGLTTINLGKLFKGDKTGFVPATALAVIKVLEHYNFPFASKKALVIGRSLTIGKPLSMLLLEKNMTVTIAHSKTLELQKLADDFDLVVVATGKIDTIDAALLSKNTWVIDCGYHEVGDYILGDVCNIDSVLNYTPRTGGIGPVTTALLISNVVKMK